MFQQKKALRAPSGKVSALKLLLPIAIFFILAGFRPVSANVVTDWNNEFLTITDQTSISWVTGPPEVARDMAILGNAMSDAVNAATGNTIASYAYTGPAVSGADANVAAAAAAYTALASIYNDAAWQTPLTTQTGPANVIPASTLASTVMTELSSFLTTSLGFDPTGCASSSSANCVSYNLGVAAGNAVAAKQSTDGAVGAIQNGLNRNGVQSSYAPGTYQPPGGAGPGGRPEMLPQWGSVTPTGITASQLTAAESTVSGPPAIDSSTYAQNLLQVECQGSATALPADIQAACVAQGYAYADAAKANQSATAALFWNDPGMTNQPPGHWLAIADTTLQSTGASLLQSAQLTALLGDAENDAGIAAWGLKYQYNFWRPITAINYGCTVSTDSSGNTTRTSSWSTAFTTCDPGWTSLIATPPHPDYVAGHPAFSGAAATVLADFYGTDNISFSSTSNYYCNTGTANFDSNGNLLSCTLNGTTYSVSNPDDCAVLTDGIISNGSPLICPITETFDSFTAASSGENGSEFSRVAGGIHDPFAVVDALTVGNAIGAEVAADAGLPDIVPEPSTLAVYAAGLLSLAGLRRRQKAACRQ